MARWTGKRIRALSLYREKRMSGGAGSGPADGGEAATAAAAQRRGPLLRLQHVPFLLAYCVALYYCYVTIGDQYTDALQLAERQEVEVLSAAEKMRLNAFSFFAGEDAKIGDTTSIGSASTSAESDADDEDGSGVGGLESAIGGGRTIRVPSKYLPGFWPSVALGLVTMLHALFVLLQIWSVNFRCLVQFAKVPDDKENAVEQATHVKITPSAHKGKMELLPLTKLPSGISFEYHRRRYLYRADQDLFEKVRCRTDHPLSYYANTSGIERPEHAQVIEEVYGKNVFEMAQPNFLELYKQQLLSPFTVFQLFCVILWLLDDYWQYSVFTLFMILMFEATAVWQRQKSMTSLRGVASEARSVHIYRCGRWIKATTEDLLPADVFSLRTSKGADVIPCDCLLLKGKAVVNEASLTGESVPQMKDGLDATLLAMAKKGGSSAAGVDGTDEPLNIKGVHRIHTLYGGTRALQVSAQGNLREEIAEESSSDNDDDDDDDDADNEENVAGDDGCAESKTTEQQPSILDIDEDEDEDRKYGSSGAAVANASEEPEEEVEDPDDEDAESSENEDEEEEDDEEGDDEEDEENEMPEQLGVAVADLETPDDGVVCYVLRTGFSSSQGKLVRMIEASTQSVRGDTRDTVLLLLLLLVFALLASGYVLHHGMQDGTRSKYELLLHCILIVTSVIPPELPMQTALAVNNSLMTLMRMQVFCTEPFRVPLAGKVDFCLFDKTGTLTTDELVAVGCVSASYSSSATSSSSQEQKADPLIPLSTADPATTLVLACCHALVLVDGQVAGDPIEVSGIKSVKWEVDPDNADRVRPAPTKSHSSNNGKSNAITADGSAESKSKGSDGSATRKHIPFNGEVIRQLTILTRHHFSSKLQRMSVVATARQQSSRQRNSEAPNSGFVLAKGSPEAIGRLLEPSSRPSDFDSIAAGLAKKGMRVLALAYKHLQSRDEVSQALDSRAFAEADLQYAGFVAFSCRIRRDTQEIVTHLRDGGHRCVMVTGDAILTAVYVAREVNMLDFEELKNANADTDKAPTGTPLQQRQQREQQELLRQQQEQAAKNRPGRKQGVLVLQSPSSSSSSSSEGSVQLVWEDYESGDPFGPFRPEELDELESKYHLCTSGFALAQALDDKDMGPVLRTKLHTFAVFARMTPDQKETVITSLKDSGHTCLMCGDGANDVGALKQADVGIALLSGFGDINVDRGDKPAAAEAGDGNSKRGAGAVGSRGQQKQQQQTQRQAGGKAPEAASAAEVKEFFEGDRTRFYNPEDEKLIVQRQRILKKMTPQQRKDFVQAERAYVMQQKQEEFQALVKELEAKGEGWATMKAMKAVFWDREMEKSKKRRKAGSLENSASRMAAMFDDVDLESQDMPTVKVGDASIASPFTSKIPSVRSAVDIVRQGRCTLVTTLQMYQILALNCLIQAYSLSVLYLDGVKYGDYQMTVLGILMSTSFITISRVQPLSRLSPVRPLASVFHPALFLSLLGQFSLHLSTMIWLVSRCKTYLPPDHKVDLDGEFKPDIVNTVVFLVSAVQQVSVFVVNLKGPPFMEGFTKNKMMLYSLICTFVLTFMCASESVPQLNSWLKLVAFPTVGFRTEVLSVLFADISLAFFWDRFLLGVFAYPVLRASLEGITMKDVMTVVKAVVVISLIVYWISSQEYDEELWAELMDEGNEAKDRGIEASAMDMRF